MATVREYAHTIPANPMSDRGQMVIEIYEIKEADVEHDADEGG